jgi:hydrogenase small subunit
LLLSVALHLARMAPAPDLDEQGRPERIYGRTVHEGCDRAGFAEMGQFAETHGDGRCLVKLGCKGPVVKCNVPIRGWVGGVGGCPNVGGICMACTMPGFPDKYMPFMEPDAVAKVYARTARIAHGPLVRYMRQRRIRRVFDVEPEWRRRGPELTSGYQPR